ncbi:MAG: archaeosortase/exosortase family protein [Sulfurovum sp.]|nr:archaeosortase/exosortase family protein [Sulfurovum sp.]
MKRFIIGYFLSLGALLFIFYTPFLAFSSLINTMQTTLTLEILAVFLADTELVGIDIWIHPHYKIIISDACNGLMPILFFYASIFAYPSSFSLKMYAMIVGYIVFFIVNIVRILGVVWMTKYGEGQGEFYWSHDIVGNILLMLTGLGLFIGFIHLSTKTRVKDKKLIDL